VVAICSLIATVGLGVLAYQWLKRPPDVSNPSVEFVAEEPVKKKKRKPKDLTVNWPTYGYDAARTKAFPTGVVRPPFAGSDWSFQAGKLLEFSPIIVDDVLYVQDIDARVYAIDAKTGKLKWKKRIGRLNASAPAYHDGRLFLVNLDPGQVVAMRARDGKVIWRKSLPGRSESSPLVWKGKLVIFGCECGSVYAMSTKDGSLVWEVKTAGAVKGALAFGKGKVFGGNYAGEYFAIDVKTGKVRWKREAIGGSFGRGGGIYSTPAVAYGRVYFGSIDSRVYSVDMDTGEIAWSFSTGAEVYSGPAVADVKGAPPTVYIGSIDHHFYALDAKTGKLRWKQHAGGQVSGAPSVIGDVVYVGVIGPDQGTIGYRAKDGKVVFKHEQGEYNPAITDGRRLYLTGYSTIRAFTNKGLKRRLKRRERAERERRRAARRAAREAGELPPASADAEVRPSPRTRAAQRRAAQRAQRQRAAHRRAQRTQRQRARRQALRRKRARRAAQRRAQAKRRAAKRQKRTSAGRRGN